MEDSLSFSEDDEEVIASLSLWASLRISEEDLRHSGKSSLDR